MCKKCDCPNSSEDEATRSMWQNTMDFHGLPRCKCELIPPSAAVKIIDPTGAALPGDIQTTCSAQPTELDPEALEDAIKAVRDKLKKRIAWEPTKPLYEPIFARYRFGYYNRDNPSNPFVDLTIS